MSTCPRCGFWAASDRNMVKSSIGMQCPRCRALLSGKSKASMAGLDVAPISTTAASEPYVTASFLGVITPDDVGVEKRSIEPYAEETNLQVNLNKQKIPGALTTAWNDFYVSWKDFYASSTSVIMAGSAYKQALAMRAKLNALQSQIDPYLAEPTTRVPMPELTAPAAATAPGQSTTDKLAAASSQWSKVAIAAVVVGGGLAAWVIYQTSKNVGRTTDSLIGPITKALAL